VKDTNTTVPTHPRFRACVGRTKRPARPWSNEEIRVRTKAEASLKSARTWANLGFRTTAISFCLNGVKWTFGYTRPFAIRDQISRTSCSRLILMGAFGMAFAMHGWDTPLSTSIAAFNQT